LQAGIPTDQDSDITTDSEFDLDLDLESMPPSPVKTPLADWRQVSNSTAFLPNFSVAGTKIGEQS